MCDWATINAAVNIIMQETFGDSVIYQPVQAGQAAGDSMTVTAIRHSRMPEEAGAMANFEEISVNPSDFANPPAKGDWVTAWGARYVVTSAHQPDAYGMLILSLLQRS
jgi:hypothetical protein